MPDIEPVTSTGLNHLRLGLGTAFLHGLYAPVSEEQALETVRCALENGINFFDTAPLYGAGESERRLGKALKGVPRERYILSTKVGRLVKPDGTVYFDFSRNGVKRSIAESLERLKCERIDLLLIHDPDAHYREALDQAFPVLADLRSQGVIGAIGAGMNQWQMLVDFARSADFDCFLLAGRYTLLEQGALDKFLPFCQVKGIKVFLGGVYNSGILATGAREGAKYNYQAASPEVLERVRRLEAVCARYGVPLSVAALQFPLAHPAVTSLIVGAASPAEVTGNLAALQRPIPAGLWEDLRAEGLLPEEAPVPQ
ncbi:MAG TPA: aldo/keto reductase [Chloroflexia bacterium]|nr:aldo/keto reductase [Chloroflexia bacterium]